MEKKTYADYLKTTANTTNYAKMTYSSGNVLRRFSHHVRFQKSISMISLVKGIRLLDFGCGDGRFLNMLNLINHGGGYFNWI
jgi:2-polyprenyl-3-methyl-5-hydroxy-6-metoxy-1,4-benzoquinol methylase